MEPAARPSLDPGNLAPLLEELRSDIHGMRSAFLELPAMDELDSAIGQLGRQLAAVEDRVEQRLSAIEAHVATREASPAHAAGEPVAADLTAVTASVTALQEHIERGLATLGATVELRLSSIEAQVEISGSQGTGATEHWVTALTASVAELHERVDRGFGVLEDRTAELEARTEALDDVTGLGGRLDARLGDLDRRIDERVAALDDWSNAGIAALEERLLVLEGAVVGLADRFAELREALWSRRRRTPLRAGDSSTTANGPAS